MSSEALRSKEGERIMRLSAIEKKARGLGIKDTWKFTREELVRQIQKSEGFIPCYATGRRICAQMECCWREDCLR